MYLRGEEVQGHAAIIRDVSPFRGEHNIVQFSYYLGSAPYSGFYYSPDDVPVAFHNADYPLTETEVGWAWQGEGDTHGTTSRITANWFRYEAWM